MIGTREASRRDAGPGVVRRAALLVGRYWETIFIGALFVVALAVRLIGIDWGLPNQNYPYSLFIADEPNTLNATLLLSKRLYDVGVLRNQPFFYLAAFPVFVIYYLFLMVTGRIDNLIDLEALYIQDNSEFLLVGRAFVALVSALTVVLTYFVGRQLVDRRVGVLSSVFMLISFGHVVYSTVFRLDPFLPFLFLLAFYLIIRLPNARPGKLRPYVLCGLVMGLAATTKITAFALIAPFVASIILRTPGLRQWPPKLRDVDRRYPFAFTIFVATVFALTLPGYVFQPAIASSPIARLDHSGARGYTASISPYRYSLPWHLSYILPRSIGWPVYVFSWLGMVMMLLDRRTREKAILSWVTVIAFVLPIGYLIRTAWRDMLPMLPFFAIAAGYGAVWSVDFAYRLNLLLAGRLSKRLALLALLTSLIALPVYRIMDHKTLMTGEDTRDVALEWIERNIPAGSSLAIESYGPAVLDQSVEELIDRRLAHLDRPPATANTGRPVYRVFLLDQNMSHGRDMLQSELLSEYLATNEIDYVVLSSGYYGRFYNDAVDAVFPVRAAAAHDYYDLIAGSLNLVAEFIPDWRDSPGPVVKIYQVPEELPEEHLVAFGEFEPFPGMSRPASAVGYIQFSPR